MEFQMVALLTPILSPHMYLDPGSGSFIVQLVIAAIVGSGVLVKVYWRKIKGLFTRSSAKVEGESQVELNPSGAPNEDDRQIKQ